MIENNKISWFVKSDDFKAYVQPGPSLAYTYAYSASEGRTIPDEWLEVEADNWLTGKGVDANARLLEWTQRKNSYGQVLTLLWDEKGIQGWEEDGYYDEDEEVEWEPKFHNSRRKK